MHFGAAEGGPGDGGEAAGDGFRSSLFAWGSGPMVDDFEPVFEEEDFGTGRGGGG
jgi:hypothetical protein